MTLKECYTALGGGYEDVIGRLRSERIVQKFVLKFLDDSSFENLRKALEEGVQEEAFRAAHTIKGMCLNLSFTKLGASSSEITELLRGGDMVGAQKMFGSVENDYILTVAAIEAFKEDLPM